MFTQEKPVKADLKSVYCIERTPLEHAVAPNMRDGTPHHFTFTVTGNEGVMTVDGIAESRSVFHFPTSVRGYFSLASNATETEPGAFRYIRLRSGGKTLLDIDFRKIKTVDELEAYFDCYYFPDIEYAGQGRPVPLRQVWGFNERGHLRCVRESAGKISFSDFGPFCVLTLRHPPIDAFEAEVGFEQCWRRYGILFGCDKQKFAYHSLINTWETAGVRGGLAYTDAHNGACCVRGALLLNEQDGRQTNISYVEQACPAVAPRFLANEQVTLPLHTLTYHLQDHMTYRFENQVIRAKAGTVLYLPPNVPCRLEGETDVIIRIEFDCAEKYSFSPMLYSPKQSETLRKMFEELNDVFGGSLPGKEYRALSVFYRIMAELSQPMTDDATSNIIRVATRYINNHFTEPTLSVKEVAHAADVCESYLYRLFRASCGMSPKEYILNCRLQQACELLKTRYYKVYEVAEKCGFSDAKHFMTAFKREMGISPGKYQK